MRAFLLVVVAPLASALVAQAPTPTPTEIALHDQLAGLFGFSQKPTPAAVLRRHVRRQATQEILAQLGPDNTCGYVSGDVNSMKTCAANQSCGAVLGTDDFFTMGCCDGDACTMLGECYEQKDMSACDSACLEDINNVLCTASTAPYCYGYTVAGQSMGFFSCASVSQTSFDLFETTYSGQTENRSWTPLRQSDFDALSSSAPATTTVVDCNALGVRCVVSSVYTSVSTIGQGDSTTSTRSSSSPTATEGIGREKSNSAAPIGAIVGGAVGGLAIIAIIVGLIVFYLLKRRKSKEKPAYAHVRPDSPTVIGAPEVHQQDRGQSYEPYGPDKNTYDAKVAPVEPAELPTIEPVELGSNPARPKEHGGRPLSEAP